MAHINLETDKTMEDHVKSKIRQVVWSCGDLRTGAISIGVTCIVSSILLSLYYIESELLDIFSINIVVVCLLTLFLIVSDIGLIYGATKNYKLLVVPWMALHLALVIFLLFYLGIKYNGTIAAPINSVIIASTMVLIYFNVVVVFFYRELKETEDNEEVAKDDKLAKVFKNNGTEPRNEQQCLINLEVLNRTNPNNDQVAVAIDANESQLSSSNPFRADDTFTQLANRSHADKTTDDKLHVIPPNNHRYITTLDDSGEFAVPTSANSQDVNKSFKFPLTGEFSEMVSRLDNPPLPTPVEVISLKDQEFSKSDNGGINTNHNVSGDHSLNPFLNDESFTEPNDEDLLNSSNGHSTKENTKSFGNLGGIGEDEKEALNLLLPAKSEPQLLKQVMSIQQHPQDKKKLDDVVNMDLVDSSFTPYKKKSISNGHLLQENGELVEENLPKMKIFLPKQNDDSEDGDSSLSSENEDMQTSNV